MASTAAVVVMVVTSVAAAAASSSAVASGILHGLHYMDCGGELNATRGYFHTPNFPGPFPVPISCRWVLHAPVGKRIDVHFTQFFLREGVWATGFYDPSSKEKELNIGDIDVDKWPANYPAASPYLAINLRLDHLVNTNLRVQDSLLDVYGFNITYEILDKGVAVRNACSVHNCSYNGHCFVSADHSRSWCQCFPPFYGRSCQYGHDCDPDHGRNRCLNGGTCSYSRGSYYYHCLCPVHFHGYNCEIPIESYDNEKCTELNCDHLCKQGPRDVFYCGCNLGFYLNSADNHTCTSNSSIRYKIGIKLRNASYIPDSTNLTAYTLVKNSIERKLQRLLGPKVQRMKKLMVLQLNPNGVVDFHFFGNDVQGKVAEETLLAAKNSGFIDGLPIDTKHFKFEPEPALNLKSLKVEPAGGVVILDKQLVLTCITLGSSSVRFVWLKDGAPLDISKVGRNTWLRTQAKNTQEEYVAYLYIGSVRQAHSGVYTCRVRDWGEEQERSVNVRVLTRPRVSVTPMALTVHRGTAVSILCMSIIEKSVSFGYNWAKNGQILGLDNGQENVEDIYPDGSRVLIPSANDSATYTCLVNSIPGVKKVDVRITVIDPNAVQVCPAEEAQNVHWGQAAPNTRDVQPCPAQFSGNASRQCLHLGGGPSWSEPDFSHCRSRILLALKAKFENLKIGFVVTTPAVILRELLQHVKDRGSGIYPGEGSSFLELLAEIHEYEEINAVVELQPTNGTDVFFDVVSHLLSHARAINTEMKVLQLVHSVQRRALFLGRYVPTGSTLHIDKEALAVTIIRRPLAPRIDFSMPLRQIRRNHVEWFTDLIIAKVNVDETQASVDGNSSIEVAVIFYKNVSQLLPKRSLKRSSHSYFVDMEYELNSKLVTVAYHVNGQQGSLVAREPSHILVAFDQSGWEVERKGWNISCGLTNLSLGRFDWSLEGCSLVSTENVTSCLCTRFGTYVVLLTTQLPQTGEGLSGRLDSIVAIGCFVGSVLTFLALVSLAVCWRNVLHGFAILKMQICIGIFGTMTTFLTTAQFTLPKSVYPYIMALIEFFLLEPLAMQVCLELLLYLELANIKHIQHAITKITLLGWGIPTLVTGATFIVQAQNGFENKGWWMQVGDTYFLGFTISSVILLALYVLLYLVVYLELRHKMCLDSPQRPSAIKRMGLLHRSLILQLSSVAVTVTSIVYGNSPAPVYRYTFAIVCGLMGFLVFVLYTVKSESPGCVCSKRSGEVVKSSSPCPLAANRKTQNAGFDLRLDLQGVSARSLTPSSLLKLDGSGGQADVVVNSKNSESREWTSKTHGPHYVLSDEAREMEDLLHEMVTSDQNCRNQFVSGERKDPRHEVYLESPDEPDKTPLWPLLTGRKYSVPRMGIVDYEGSPKKYPSSKELTGDEWTLVAPPASSDGRHRAASLREPDGSEDRPAQATVPTKVVVPFAMDGLVRGCCRLDRGDEEESGSESYCSKKRPATGRADVPPEQMDTVV